VFENKVLRKIVGPKQENVTGDWRKLHTEVLHDLCLSPNIVWVIRSMIARCVGQGHLCGRREENALCRLET
jgi:hypothetical protein